MHLLLILLLGAATSDGNSSAEQYLKVVSYDRNLEARVPEGFRLVALCDPKDSVSCTDAERVLAEVKALARSGSKLAPLASETLAFKSEAELSRALHEKKVTALYVAKGLSPSLPAVVRAAEGAGVMTLAGDVEDVARGLAVGLSESGKIVINIGAAERCGVDLDPVVRQVAQRVGETSPDPERSKLSDTIARYRDAIRNKDIDALTAVWPGLEGAEASKVRSSMENVRSHEIAIALLRIDSEGGRLRVRVRRADRLVTREGQALVSGRLMEIYFRRSDDGGWLIDSMTGV